MDDDQGRLGPLLRSWRELRGLSQLALSIRSGVSTRHISYIETGKAVPGRATLLHLAGCLDVPGRAQNALLLAAGYAPRHTEHSLGRRNWRRRMRQCGHCSTHTLLARPSPLDRHWNLILANSAADVLLEGVHPSLLHPRPNMMCIAVHPRGAAPRIVNLRDVSRALFARLDHHVLTTADPELRALRRELEPFEPSEDDRSAGDRSTADVAVPLVIRWRGMVLRLLAATTTFGTARDVTLSELILETYLPLDDETTRALTVPRSG